MIESPLLSFYGFSMGHGGIGRVMTNLMNAMIDQGVHIDLLLPHTQSPDLASIRSEVRVINVDAQRSLWKILSLVGYLKRERPLALLCNKERANRSAIIARRIANVKTRIIIRVGTSESKLLEQRNVLKRWLRHLSILSTYRNADRIIAVSNGIAREIPEITKVPEKKIHVVPNPSVTKEMISMAQESIEHPWFSPENPSVILAVGRLVPIKDYPTLLKAFSFVLEHRDCRLVILGEGRERDLLQSLAVELRIEKKFDIPGFVSNPFPFMKRSALVALSSLREGSPNVLIESLAVGTPVVSTDCPWGPREILQNGIYGKLTPVGDPKSLAEAICSTLENPPERSFLQSGVSRFFADKSAREYMDVMLGSH